MANIFPALWKRVKADPRQLLDPQLVDEAIARCEATAPPRVSQRPSRFTPYLGIVASVIQAIHGNTALTDLVALLGHGGCAGTLCRLRQNTPLELFENVSVEVAQRCLNATENLGTWHGFRVFVFDGTGFSMPDLPGLAAFFGKPARGGKPSDKPLFPFAHALAMLDLATGMFVKACVFPGYTHDLQGTCDLHRQLVGKGDLILADRAFGSVAHFATIAWHGLDAVMRVKEKGHRGGKARGRGLGKIPRLKGSVRVRIVSDEPIEKRLPTQAPTTVDASIFGDLPDVIGLRQTIFELRCSGYRSQRICLWTTLMDVGLHDAESLAALYLRRWQIEVGFRDLKRTTKTAVLKGQSPEVVLKEFWGHLLAYNLVRMVAVEAAGKRGVDSSRVSFISAWRWLRRMTTPPQDPADGPAGILVNSIDPRHEDVRCIKRPPPNYTRLSKARDDYFMQPEEAAGLAGAA